MLILSASAGNGHTRAASALTDAFRTHFQNAADSAAFVEHWDILDYATPPFRWLFSRGYALSTRYFPLAFRLSYRFSNKAPDPRRLTPSIPQRFERANLRRLLVAVDTFQPTVLVATHFTPVTLFAGAQRPNNLPPLNVAITDFDLHGMWIGRSVNRYFVASADIAQRLAERTNNTATTTVTGIPIAPAFANTLDKAAARESLNLEHRPTLLIAATALSADALRDLMVSSAKWDIATQLVFLTGRDASLKKMLEYGLTNMPPAVRDHTRIVGFTDRMHDFMAAADVMITKPGGLTCAEALSRKLPLILVNPIPEQEERNRDHLVKIGAAVSSHEKSISRNAYSLLSNPTFLSAMSHVAAAASHPDAASEIVRTILQDATALSLPHSA